MNRKLFLSYIQNMQQNNPDMIGFQNSLTKNSWLKPKSLYETNDDEYQVPERDFNEEEVIKKIRDELPDLAAEAHKQFLEDDGTGHPKDYWGKPESRDFLATHKNIENKWHFLSDSGRDDLVGDFRAHIGDIHAAHMASQEADGRDWYADREMTHGQHGHPNNPLREAVLRTGNPESYWSLRNRGGVFVDRRQISRKHKAGRVLTALMDPNHPINNDPAHADERESLIRALTDMGYFPDQRDNSNYGKVSGGDRSEILGAPANDPTRTGPGTHSANVQDLRRYAKFADERVYRKFYGNIMQPPPGFMEPTDQ